MISEKIKNGIVKFMNKSASVSDLEILEEWIKIDENKNIFKDYVHTHYAINYSLSELDVDKILDVLLQKIQKNKSKYFRLKFQSVLKYAAIIILFLGVGYLYQNYYLSNDKSKNIIIPNDKITLAQENGEVKFIKENNVGIIQNENGKIIGLQKGNQITFKQNNSNPQIVFNTINVPYGKKIKIELSDGTIVHLNSGTSLKFPTDFVEGSDRKVFLKGEAYFDVTDDDKHPFIVNADEVDIRVLGTMFNISAYGEDKELNTVLVEGSVSMYERDNMNGKNNPTVLTPGKMATWDKRNKSINVNEVDVNNYISWIEGKLVFANTPFSDIIKILERNYNVEIINNNLILDTQLYDATFDIETIEEVLNSFNKSYAIKYIISNNKIIIN